MSVETLSTDNFADTMKNIFDFFTVVAKNGGGIDTDTTNDGKISLTSGDSTIIIPVELAKTLALGFHATGDPEMVAAATEFDRLVAELTN